MMKFSGYIIAALLPLVELTAASLPEEVVFHKNGSFQFGEVKFQIQSFSENWIGASNSNWKIQNSRLTPDGLALTAKMTCGSVPVAVSEKIQPLGDERFRLIFEAKFQKEINLKSIHGALLLPAAGALLQLNRENVKLPEKPDRLTVMRKKDIRELAYAARNGLTVVVSGKQPFDIVVQDNRKLRSASPTFSVRILAKPSNGKMRESSLVLDFEIVKPKCMPVDLAQVANMGYKDEFAGDGRGGWTDQGPENDLRDFTPGKLNVMPVEFKTIDPKKNAGRAVLVLAGAKRSNFSCETTVALPKNNGARAVQLLHASAWTPAKGDILGELVARYADGSEETIPVKARLDVGNWWGVEDLPNAVVGWKSENSENVTGLYATSFPLPKPGPVALILRLKADSAMWMIVGISLTERPVAFRTFSGKPVVIREGKEWARLNFSGHIEKGSPLDFSFLADAPAGKYGRVIVAKDGTLTFRDAPEKRLRLYGTNLCFSANFLDREMIEQLVSDFVKSGYNTVRIHHHDTDLLDPEAEDSLTFDPVKLDKLDYLFYRMKEAGLYITTDFYTNRIFKPGDNIPECKFYNQRQMKVLLPLSRAAMENWKEFVRRWMSHRNPYTGMTWGEDPAFYCVNLVNEETLISNWTSYPQSTNLYKEKFRQYLELHGLDPATPAHNSNPVFFRFLNELQQKVLEEQIHFVKNELKLKILVTSLNYVNHLSLALLRQQFDVVDLHSYFDHPRFKGKWGCLPYYYHQNSAIAKMAQVPRDIMPCRIFGKPFIISEFNYCSPNVYRAEGGPLIGAYAALQNWDALYRFCWNSNKKFFDKPIGLTRFDAVDDPLAQLSDRIAVAMFRRGDVRTAEAKFGYVVKQNAIDEMENVTPVSFRNLGLIAQIGSIPPNVKPNLSVKRLEREQASNPDMLDNPAVAEEWRKIIQNGKSAISSTGEIRLDASRKQFTVTTALTESITLESGTLAAGILRVSNADSFQTVAAISLDGNPLGKSSSILILHLSDIANSGYTYRNGLRTTVTAVGGRPLLIRKAMARVELAAGGPFRVQALSSEGLSYGEIQGRLLNGVFQFPVNTTRFAGGVMAYWLTR